MNSNLLMYVDSNPEFILPEVDDIGKTSSLLTKVSSGEHVVTVQGNDVISVHLLSDTCRILEESVTNVDTEDEEQAQDPVGFSKEHSALGVETTVLDKEDHLPDEVTPVNDVRSKLVAHAGMKQQDSGSITVHTGLYGAVREVSDDEGGSGDEITSVAGAALSALKGGNTQGVGVTEGESPLSNTHLLAGTRSQVEAANGLGTDAIVSLVLSGAGLLKGSFAVVFALPFVALWLAAFMLICWCTDRNSGDKKNSNESATSSCGSRTPGSRTTVSERRGPVVSLPGSSRSVRGLYKPTFDTGSAETVDTPGQLCPELTLTENSEAIVLMPSLWPQVGELSVHTILDVDHNALMQVSITSTPMTAAQGSYSEYVLLSQRNEREVGFCEVTVQRDAAGGSANGLIYRWNGHLFAKLTERPSHAASRQRSFAVNTVAKGTPQQQMIITGDFLSREVQVMNTADDSAVALSTTQEGVSSVVDDYYRLLLQRNTDAGLVLLSLLVIDRILQPSWGTRPKNGDNAPSRTVLPTVLPRPPSFSVDPNVFSH
jgi:hypothetical protein